MAQPVKPIEKLTEREHQLIARVIAQQAKLQHRLEAIPLLTPLLAAFGLVTIFYGLEKLLDQTDLANRPVEMIIVGVIILLLTGAYYRKL